MLDAVRMELPTALVAHSLTLEKYSFLYQIRTEEEWKAFLLAAFDVSGKRVFLEAGRKFVDHVLLSGNAAERIVADLIGCIKINNRKAI